MKKAEEEYILITDVGSTTTKGLLLASDGDKLQFMDSIDVPTTVEKPTEDVKIGVMNVVKALQSQTGIKTTDSKGEINIPYLTTSSAGGGLQMMVSGVVMTMTAESAERAALGAGAIVMDVLASNDGRLAHEKIERIRRLRPDMILLSGGIDGGTTKHVVELAELIAAARPRPRLGSGYNLPVIYAGNNNATEEIEKTLSQLSDLKTVENI